MLHRHVVINVTRVAMSHQVEDDSLEQTQRTKKFRVFSKKLVCTLFNCTLLDCVICEHEGPIIFLSSN